MATPSPVPEQASIMNVFELLDAKKAGEIGIDMIFEFTDCFTVPISHEDVTQLFQDFDVDGNGRIDKEEWVDLCVRFETLSGFTRAEMVEAFRRYQFETLFDLADDDGGGTIDKSEFKNLIETLNGMLALRQTAADVSMILRPYEDEELSFKEFYPLLSKMLEGKNIIEIVDAFREARYRRQEQKYEATQAFESLSLGLGKGQKGSSEADSNATPRVGLGRTRRGMTRTCLSCTKKEVEIQELRERLAALEEASAANGDTDISMMGSFASLAHTKPSVRKYELSIEPKIWEAVRTIETSVGCFKEFPQTLRASVAMTRSRRIKAIASRSLASNSDTLMDEMSETGQRCHDTLQAYSGIFDSLVCSTREMTAIKHKFLRILEDRAEAAPGVPIECEGIDGLLEMSAQYANLREKLSGIVDNTTWMLDGVVEARTSLCDLAIEGTVHSNKGKRLMEAVLATEVATQELVEISTVMMYGGCDNWGQIECLLDEAVGGNMIVDLNAEELKQLRNNVGELSSRISRDSIEALIKASKDSVFAMQVLASSLVARTRDRGVNTKMETKVEEIVVMTESKPGKIPHISAQKSDWHSPPPRTRKRKMPQQITIEAFDSLIALYLRAGVKVPSNFGRIGQFDADSKRNTFAFGTKKIDMVMVDNSLCVIVGGGFLMFDEFCLKYTHDESSRLVRFKGDPLRDPTMRSVSVGSVSHMGDASYSRGTSPSPLAGGGGGWSVVKQAPTPTSRQDPSAPSSSLPRSVSVASVGANSVPIKMTPKQRAQGMFN